MKNTPRGMRLHIGIFGRRNAGKSSLLNAVVRQEVAIVSPEPGTTTDPVEKPMELLPFGPVVFIDTAGLDDGGELGEERVRRTRQVFDRTDLALLVAGEEGWGSHEQELLAALRSREIPVVVALNKADRSPPPPRPPDDLGVPVIETSALEGRGLRELKDAMLQAAPPSIFEPKTILGDLVPPGEVALLVVPIDGEAPRGRLILPQVQVLRDLLDNGAMALVSREHEVTEALGRLDRPPALVVTDSQAFAQVAQATPADVPLTSFSILFARLKGDLREFARGARAIASLKPGDKVLVAEACTHHPTGEDIGRVKIPAWLQAAAGGPLHFHTVQGRDFPDDPGGWDLVVHCGGCMWNRRSILARQAACREAGVPMSNYGLVIAACHGLLERSLAPFEV